MIDSILDSHGNELASAVDPKEIICSKNKHVSMEDLQEFANHGLNGLRQLVEIYDNQLSDFVLDLVPYLTKFHYEYDSSKHSCITDKLKANCSNKELVLVASEQLSLSTCPNTYPLLLPLFDLSQPYNASWLGSTLITSVTKAVVCDRCLENSPDISCYQAVIDCLSVLDTSQCSEESLTEFQKLVLFVVDSDRTLFSGSSIEMVHRILGKLDLDFSSILTKSTTDNWDPRCVMLVSYFPNSVPLVYDFSWLFSNVLPWLLLVLEDIGSFVEGDDVRPVLNTTMFFTKQSFKIHSFDFVKIRNLFDSLISIAVNNTIAMNRSDASKSIALLSARFVLQDRLKLVKHYTNHENNSVAGLFIDMLKKTLANDGNGLSSFKILKLIRPLLNIENCDVLECSHKILAILSLIQLVSTLPILKEKCSNLDVQFHQFTKTVEDLVKIKQMEVNAEVSSLGEDTISSSDRKVPATISVQGEMITEPSAAEQLQSLQLARCRLDLILFNLARTGEALDNLGRLID